MGKQIALDGPAGAGKSSVAKEVSKRLGFIYVDTGAMYRGIATAVIDNNIDIENDEELEKFLSNLKIRIEYIDDKQHVIVNDKDVTDRLRTQETGEMASKSSAKPQVRKALLDIQHQLAKDYDVVMDGRDIGTVILPEATLKIFLTASVTERAKRRYDQLVCQGEKPEMDDIIEEIKSRDHRDSNRAAAPLKQADDAVYLDTSDMGIEEVINTIISLYREADK